MKKYELDQSTKKIVQGHTLRRIVALRDFGDVKSGDVGGWVKSENNLSHKGKAWAHDESCIFGGACVMEDAQICDTVEISNKASVIDNALVSGKSKIMGNRTKIGGRSLIMNAFVGRGSQIMNVTIVGVDS